MATIDLNHDTICINPTDDLTLYDKNNIMSRIEKFLFAICSLDSSDLPVPLSRIEELYYCLVTGDTPPTFEPLSRAEKFLMACLGVYDVNKLPEPLSRSEVLLKKIATGDSNLEDVDNLQSKYEFLLAYIIQNGGIGDFDEYDLNTQFNTLYNTEEKPVKSAILTGQTLVNLIPNKQAKFDKENISENAIILWENNTNVQLIKPNTKYLLIANITRNIDTRMIVANTEVAGNPCIIYDSMIYSYGETGMKKAIVTSLEDVTNCELILRSYILSHNNSNVNIAGTIQLIEYQDGMENWDIPYFEGMASVKMPVLTTTGKNILNINENNFGEFLVWGDNGSTPVEYIENEKAFYTPTHRMLRLQNLKPNKTYTLSFDVKRVSSGNFCAITLFTGYAEEIGWVESENNTYIRKHYTFTTTENVTKIEVTFYNTVYFKNLQLVEGTITEYEPFKSNILTCNEEVVLHGIGDVKDELNLVTGELTQRIGEIVLDGTQEYEISSSANGENTYYTQILINNIVPSSIAISSAFPTVTKNLYLPENDFEGMRVTSSGKIQMKILKNKLTSLDSQGFINYFKNNPLKVLFQQNEQSVKTVDLSVVDQDGNDTKLSTFNDITHVTLSSEGLIPEAELEVATKNKEDLEDSSDYTVHTLSEEFNTLYNTEEKPVKSAMLKGQTLVNLASEKNTSIGGEDNITCVLPYKVDKITVYFLDPTYSKFQYFEYDSEGTYIRAVNSYIPSDRVMFISLDDATIGKIGYLNPDDINTSKNIVVMYGDTRDIKITKYFEGVQSVKMPVLTTVGKNLFNESVNLFNVACSPNASNSWKSSTGGNRKSIRIRVKPNTKYTISKVGGDRFAIFTHNSDFDTDKTTVLDNFIVSNNELTTYTLTTPATAQYLIAYLQMDSDDLTNIQVVEGENTPYEPYKSNILTCNEEVELRGIGDVKDELNVLTGEVTQRVEEIVLDGSEDWKLESTTEVTQVFRYDSGVSIKNIYQVVCDKFPLNADGDVEKIAMSNNGIIYIAIDKTKADSISKFKTWLNTTQVSIQILLAQPTVKTVDLSIIDQDGNDTKLSTFNDITHVTLSSEGLIPEAELEVAEKVPEIAASILTISREQEVIDSATNKQSENVNATMIATTEIYEGLL